MLTALLTVLLFSHGSSDPIRYRELSWEDFRASKPVGKDAVAETRTQLEIETTELEGKMSYNVYAVFLPDESFTATNRWDILAHENTHFRIAALFGKKCMQAIAPYQNKSSSYEQKVNRILDYYSKEIDAMNEAFDKDSHHGQWEVVEKVWESKIISSLNKLQ